MQKPSLHKRLFWEFDFDQIDWKKYTVRIIRTVIERCTKEEWQEDKELKQYRQKLNIGRGYRL